MEGQDGRIMSDHAYVDRLDVLSQLGFASLPPPLLAITAMHQGRRTG